MLLYTSSGLPQYSLDRFPYERAFVNWTDKCKRRNLNLTMKIGQQAASQPSDNGDDFDFADDES